MSEKQILATLEALENMGLDATRSDAELIVDAVTANAVVQTRSVGTQGVISTSPAASDPSSDHIMLARTRDPKIITQQQTTRMRSA